MSDSFNTAARPESGRKLTTRDITVCALSIALIAVCSWISIPMTIPFTLQTFAVCLVAALLGARRGVISVLAYILLGAIGVPVFAGFKGGIGSLLGPTGGYIIGFIFTAFIAGLAAEHFGRKLQILIPAMILGILICYAFGTAWFVIVYTRTKEAIGIGAALGWCVTPYIPADAVKLLLASFLACRLYPALTRGGLI